MAKRAKVLIAGGGLGGLALAQGLTASGFDVAVFERDEQKASRLQGYRLSLNPDGLGALKALLPAERWAEIKVACTAPLPGIAFLSQRLETRFFKKTPDPESEDRRYSSISRITLREILLRGIEDRVHFGRTCTGYDVRPDGRVACLFDGNEPAVGDLLVGADGVHSAVRMQLMPSDNRYETGVSAIAGKVPSHGEAAAMLTKPPIGASAVIAGDAPQGLFIADHQLAAEQAGESYLFWSFLSPIERFPDGVADAAPAELLQIVDRMTPDWHPRLKELIHAATPASALLLSYTSSRRPDRWASGPVTLIGDAVHNMPPTGGEGANMALRDAATLRAALTNGDVPPIEAVPGYEDAMMDYAFEAVATSMSNLDRMVRRK